MKELDVLIIGGGPAGTTTGLTILKKPNISVGIIEQSNYSESRIGEVLSPGMRNMLEYFDVWQEFKNQHALDAFSSQSAWGQDEIAITDYLFTIHGSGWHLNRVAFDKMLADKFSSLGGELFLNTKYIQAEEVNNFWHVKVKKGDSTQTIKAKYIVDASGRKGLFAQQKNVTRVKDDQLVGIGCFGQVELDSKVEQSIFIEACEYGWWYSAPTPNNQMSIILMTDIDIIIEMGLAKQSAWKQFLNQTKHTSKRIQNVSIESNPRSFLAYSSKLTQAGGKNWLAVGDAFSSHDPLSSSGIPHALGSGSYAGRVVVTSLQGNYSVLEDYNTEITNQYHGYLDTKRKYYQFEQRWPNSKFWKRRNDTISINAEMVLDKSLNLPKYPVHLSTNHYQVLNNLQEKGNLAHTLVSKFKEQHPEIADQSVILGLQEML